MIVLPKWISILLEKALRKYFCDKSIEIIEYTSSLAIPVGENFTTDIFRIFIGYKTDKCNEKKTVSVIVKSSSPNEGLVNYSKLMGLFEQEIAVYTEVIPAFKNLLDGEQEIISPKYISSIKEPNSAIILEDLTTIGFKMYPRLQGLDLQHCLLAIEKLAYFHAASAILYEKEPSVIKHYNHGIFWDNPFTRQWITIGFSSLINATAKWSGCEKYSRKLKCIEDKVFEKTLRAGELKLGDFSVLNHGDFWSNNFMFSYTTDNQVKDCRFVDFQVAFHSSPAIDLNYFWATTPNITVKNQHYEAILNHYYEKLISILTKQNYSLTKIPNKEQFRKDLNNRAFYGLAGSVTVLPIITASARDDATFEKLFEYDGEDGFRYHAYNNERYKEHMEYLLPFYDSLGILDEDLV